jgi:hypothetical protein
MRAQDDARKPVGAEIVRLDDYRELRSSPHWDHALVSDGDYDAHVVYAETWTRRSNRGWAPRLAVWWRVVEPGYMGIVLPAWYRIIAAAGKRRYRVAPRARLQMDLAVMLDRRPPTDRFPLEDLRDHIYRVRTRTVTTTADDYGHASRKLPEPMRYSIVQHVVGIVT